MIPVKYLTVWLDTNKKNYAAVILRYGHSDWKW